MLGRYGLLTQIPALEIITAWEQKMKKMRTEELKTRRREKQQVFFYQRGNPKGYTHEIQ
jgi:sarcosine oxidase delta subunit